MPDAPTAASLFSGVGLLDLGLEWAGFDVRWGCEIDPWCRDLWVQRFNRPCYSDASALPYDELERCLVLAGGFPCQPASLAGKGLAQKDPRWLWPLYERAIRRLRPRYVIVENVLGLVQRGMADVLGDLAALGFDAEWTVFGASDVGAPHRRRRVWIVAAHPDETALWDERGGFFGPGWAGTGLAGHDGAQGPVADADGGRRREVVAGVLAGQRDPHRGGEDVADTDEGGRSRGPGDITLEDRGDEPADGGVHLADADGAGPQGGGPSQQAGGRRPADGGWWAAEPDVGRVAHGVPARVDRLAGLGNGVVPQAAQLVGRRLLSLIPA